MTNIEKILEFLQEYRRMAAFYDRTYREGVKELENGGHEGSEYYERKITALSEDKAEKLDIMRRRIAKDADEVFAKMRKNALREAPEPPTQEMLEVLELLKMREAITQSELDSAVATCKKNALALGVLREIAQKNNLTLYGAGARSTVGNSTTTDAIDTLENHLRWTLRLDKINAKSQYYQEGIEATTPTGTVTADTDGILKARHDVELRTVEELAAFAGIKDLEKFVETTL